MRSSQTTQVLKRINSIFFSFFIIRYSIFYTELSDPDNSLYAKNNGLDDIFKIIKNGVNYLSKNSYIVIEHSHNQTLILKNYSRKFNLRLIESKKDSLGLNRVSIFSNQI